MSGILKPLTHSLNVISGSSDAVNIDHIASMTRNVVDPAPSANTAGSYTIVFKLRGDDTSPVEVVWSYVDEATMDTDYASLLVNNSVAV